MPGRPSRSSTLPYELGLLVWVAACGGGGGDVGPPPSPAAINVLSGNRQTGPAGTALTAPVSAKVTTATGTGVEGVAVSFAVAPNSGTISSASATTDADGIASTSWTVGAVAGADLDTLRASVSGLSEPAVFTATVTAAAPASLEIVAGNAQTAPPSQPLPQLLQVSVKDQFGNPNGQVDVAWSVTSGGGSIVPPTGTTGMDGRTSAGWTLGSAKGTQTATATVVAASGLSQTFTATAASAGQVTLTAISPNPIVEGQPATLTGVGFSTTPGDNVVKIDGSTATVAAATATSLTVNVPSYNCQPARGVPISVTVGGNPSNVLNQSLNPSAFTAVGTGHQLVLQNPGEFCLQFRSSSSAEDYLIGVQSTSEVVTSLTPAALTAVAAPGPVTAALPVSPDRAAHRSSPSLPGRESAILRTRHYAAEARLRENERRELGSKLSLAIKQPSPAGLGRASIPPDAKVGDVVEVRVRTGSCSDYSTIQAVVRVIGAKGVWVEDLENPEGGFSLAEIQDLSHLLDDAIYATDVDYFGSPSDIDANGRIVVAITKELNKIGGILGRVTLADLFPTSVCAASNEGELYYTIAPDPTGTFGFVFSKEEALHEAPPVIAHELTHIIQFSRRIALNASSLLAIWEAEGQAVLAEEVNGHAQEGRKASKNYPGEIAFNQDDPGSIDWYSYGFTQNAFYYGFNGTATKVPGAPEECSWLDNSSSNTGPCLTIPLVYGPTWLLLRWLSDHFGPTFPGGEKGLQKALIENLDVGYANIANTVGVPIETLLAEWAAMLYADDRVPGLEARLTLPSWNLYDVYDLSAVEAAHLSPRSRAFASFSDEFSVRAGSSAYFRVSGASHPATAIRVRTPSDEQLPSVMQMFIVRLQ